MRSLLLLLLWVLLLQNGFSQISQLSFYFNPVTCGMTDSSKSEFLNIQTIMDKFECQIIELNAFAEAGPNSEKNAQCFADSILKRLPEQMTEPSVNIYGAHRVALNFTPTGWNRVDLYFYVGKEKMDDVQINYTGNTNENDTVTIAEMEARAALRIPPSLDNIVEGVPIVTPITFIGGKAKVTKDSYPYLDYLRATLVKNPDLSAHIRGHVCCGPNFRISNARAKTVYKYLIKHGISKTRLSYKGYSNNEPVVWPEKTNDDRKSNRRVDIIFKKTDGGDEIIL